MSKKVKVGIVGCGGIANFKHLPSLKKIEEVELVAFCDIKLDRAEKTAKQFGVLNAKVCTDYRDILEDETIGVIHVLTPNSSHAEISIAAMKAGKHVMCEKPMAKNYNEALEMLEASKETGMKLTIGYQNRFREENIYLKKACERGDLGEIYFAKAHAVRRRAVPTWGVFLDEEAQGGGPLIDIGTHALDLTLWCMDNYKPKSVMGNIYKKLNENGDCGNCFGAWNPEEYTVEDSAFGFITMENGATIILESSWALNILHTGEAKTTLCGTKAGADTFNNEGLRINSDDFGKLTVLKPALGADGVDFYEGDSAEPNDVEARIWYDHVLYNKELIVKPEEALMVTRILEAIYESAKTGNPVYF